MNHYYKCEESYAGFCAILHKQRIEKNEKHMKKNTVVVAHYDKDISWIDEIEDKDVQIEIYSNSGEYASLKRKVVEFKSESNYGADAHLYLSYIIENYENLPDNILFLQHHRNDWSQDFDAPKIVDMIRWDYNDFFNVGSRGHYNRLFIQGDYGHGSPKDWLRNSWHIFEGKFDFPEEIFYYAGGQFKVSRSSILQHTKEFYQRLDSWLKSTDYPYWISARVFEYTWHLIFTGNPTDQTAKAIDIFKIHEE